MASDAKYTYLHFHESRHVDLWENFNTPSSIPHELIDVAPQHQPPNPEDEDDIVPDQHAAFGIQNATQKKRVPAWQDLDLDKFLATVKPENTDPNRPPPVLPRAGEAAKRLGLGMPLPR